MRNRNMKSNILKIILHFFPLLIFLVPKMLSFGLKSADNAGDFLPVLVLLIFQPQQRRDTVQTSQSDQTKGLEQ